MNYVEKFKTRLVTKRFKWKKELRYFDVYFLIAPMATINILITLLLYLVLKFIKLIKIAFLNDYMNKEIS